MIRDNLLIAALLRRLGGSVTITDQELFELDPREQVILNRFDENHTYRVQLASHRGEIQMSVVEVPGAEFDDGTRILPSRAILQLPAPEEE